VTAPDIRRRERRSNGWTLSTIFSAWHNREARILNVDLFAVTVALLLPWSTSGVAIGMVVWLIALVPTLDIRPLLLLLKRSICVLPIALVALAILGTLWSDAPWGIRLYALNPVTKLLALPLLFYHFERSTRGIWVFNAFLISCALLMLVSWLVMFEPGLSLKQDDPERGIFVKNYIDQSQEFALCAVALGYPIVARLQEKRTWQALLLGAVALGLVANMTFVVVSRTAMVTMPIMIAVFTLMHLRWRTNIVILCLALMLAALAWVSSPQLRSTTERFTQDYQIYKEQNQPTSIGLRLEYWTKSLRFFADAPVIGHGTGSTRGLFEHAATGPAMLAQGQVIGNPHNQTLNVAVQWGTAGVVVLYAMWLSHLRLFRGEGLAAWIGFLVVLQNIFSSLFNSHLFDFHEGWLYVLGVGVAGGMTLKARSGRTSKEPEDAPRA